MTLEDVMDPRFEILDAFVDGEPVDPVRLKDALADPDGRDYFVDVWALRSAVHDEVSADTVSFGKRPPSRARSWVLAAAAASVCLVGGYAAGSRFGPLVAPPATSTLTTVQPDDAAPGAFPVPVPTRVIRLDLDPNWTERTGAR
jgi:hypothetical protein